MDIQTIIGIILGIIVIWGIILYNRLVRLRVRTTEAWADIDVQLKRRYELIPNLVETVKGYASHERELFERVTQARSQAMQAGNIEEQQAAENQLTGALKSLFAVSENYPDLKANENFLELQRELTDTENKIQAARRFYNTNVRDYNTLIETVPAMWVADVFGFDTRDFFEIEEGSAAREPVEVSF